MSGIGALQAGVVDGPLSVALIEKSKKIFENWYRIGRPCHLCAIGQYSPEIVFRCCRRGVTVLVSKAADNIAPEGRLPDLAGEDENWEERLCMCSPCKTSKARYHSC